MKRNHRNLAKAAVLGAAVLVAEVAAIQAVASGAGRWVREGDGAALARAARATAGAVAQSARACVEDAMLQSARFAARHGAPTDAFVLAHSLRRQAGLPEMRCERARIARSACEVRVVERRLRVRERVLRSAIERIEKIQKIGAVKSSS